MVLWRGGMLWGGGEMDLSLFEWGHGGTETNSRRRGGDGVNSVFNTFTIYNNIK